MKAVVVELKGNYAAVLSDDGCVVTTKNNGYVIGQVIQISKPKVEFPRKMIAFAASAAAFVVFGVSSWAYASPYSYVSLDVNPSIEYTVNRFDRVLTVKAVNDDGEEILKEISLEDLKNKTIADALTNTIEQISEAGYFDGTSEGGIVIATSGKNREKAEQLASYLQETVETEVTENGDNVEIEAFSVGLDRVEEARALGVTPGKLNLVEKLQDSASDPASIDAEEWLNKSVKDIMSATKENKKSEIISGSAISIEEKDSDQDTNDVDKNSSKEEKKLQKEEEKLQQEKEKLQKKEEKAIEKDNKALEKETKQAEKSAENAAADEENFSSKAKEKARKTKEQVTVAKEKAVSETPQQPSTTEKEVTDNIDKNVKKENAEPTAVPSDVLKKNEKSEIKSQTNQETSTGQENEATVPQVDNTATGTNGNKNSTDGSSDNASVSTNKDNSGAGSENTGSNSSSSSSSNSENSGSNNNSSSSDNSGSSSSNSNNSGSSSSSSNNSGSSSSSSDNSGSSSSNSENSGSKGSNAKD